MKKMFGVLMEFRSDNAEAVQARAREIVKAYQNMPGFKGITFFNDIKSNGNTHGFLFSAESEEVTDSMLAQINSADLSSVSGTGLQTRKFELFPY
jgi:hypothetical protein